MVAICKLTAEHRAENAADVHERENDADGGRLHGEIVVQVEGEKARNDAVPRPAGSDNGRHQNPTETSAADDFAAVMPKGCTPGGV